MYSYLYFMEDAAENLIKETEEKPFDMVSYMDDLSNCLCGLVDQVDDVSYNKNGDFIGLIRGDNIVASFYPVVKLNSVINDTASNLFMAGTLAYIISKTTELEQSEELLYDSIDALKVAVRKDRHNYLNWKGLGDSLGELYTVLMEIPEHEDPEEGEAIDMEKLIAKSEQAYRRALKIHEKKEPDKRHDEQRVNILTGLGFCKYQQKKFYVAMDYFKKALKIDGKNDVIRVNMGQCYLALSKNGNSNEMKTEAVKWFTEANKTYQDPDLQTKIDEIKSSIES